MEETGMTMALRHQAWLTDQLAKSQFFHQKLHEWEMLSVAQKVEAVRGGKVFNGTYMTSAFPKPPGIG
jgi:hypothetical protein